MGHPRNLMGLSPPSDDTPPSHFSGSSVPKGGRKPIYSTSEERKIRNRHAQAAFRERRTEHIKELEELAEIQKVEFQRLQAAHAQATDECLILRYKNSLLERILLEKGVDVQAELYMRRDTSYIDPMEGVTTFRRAASAFPPVKKSALKPLQMSPPIKHSPGGKSSSPPSLATTPQSSIDGSQIIPKTPISTPAPTREPTTTMAGPGTPRAELEKTTSQSDGVGSAEMLAANVLKRLKGNQSGSMRDTAAYFLSSFLEHIESLDKEAHEEPNPLTQSPKSSPTSPANLYRSHSFEAPPDCQMENTTHTQSPHSVSVPEAQIDAMPSFAPSNYYEQMLHADPFGLEASMHFPTTPFKF